MLQNIILFLFFLFNFYIFISMQFQSAVLILRCEYFGLHVLGGAEYLHTIPKKHAFFAHYSS